MWLNRMGITRPTFLFSFGKIIRKDTQTTHDHQVSLTLAAVSIEQEILNSTISYTWVSYLSS